MKLKHPFLLNIFHTIRQEGLWIHVTYAWLMFYSRFSGMPEEHSFTWRIRVRIAVWELHSPTANVIRCPMTAQKLRVDDSKAALTKHNHLPSLSLGSKERGHGHASSPFLWNMCIEGYGGKSIYCFSFVVWKKNNFLMFVKLSTFLIHGNVIAEIAYRNKIPKLMLYTT